MLLTPSPKRQTGSMLIIAIFAMIVLTLLGLTLVNIVTSTGQSVVYAVAGVRAEYAAKAGIEQLISDSIPVNSSPQVCSGSKTINLSAIDGFSNCYYTARCETQSYTESSSNYYHYQFKSTGYCEGAKGIASHTYSYNLNWQQ